VFGFLSNRNERRSHPGHERGRARVAFAAELVFSDVSKRYGESLALDHVSLDVPPGKVLCLLGLPAAARPRSSGSLPASSAQHWAVYCSTARRWLGRTILFRRRNAASA